jgi:hypothetical protein
MLKKIFTPTRLGVILAILLIAGVVGGVALYSNRSPLSASPQIMTMDPRIIANLTTIPDAAPLSGAAAAEVNELHTLVKACVDYSPERLTQMEQHIEWLLNPAKLSRDMILALGPNPTGRLIFGMASYTSTQWRLKGRPPDSCLLPIGRMLNTMLVAAGEEPMAIFD